MLSGVRGFSIGVKLNSIQAKSDGVETLLVSEARERGI